MAASPDPQTWIFPPLGAAVLPSDVSAAFGPISKGDKIQLVWAPASSTPAISFICAQSDGTTYTVSSGGNTSPYTYTFTETIADGSSHVCWLFFPETSLGNTVTFSYSNTGTGSSQTWQQDSQLAAALSGSGSSNNNNGGGSIQTVTQTITASGSAATGSNSNNGGSGGSGGSSVSVSTVATLTFTTTLLATPSTFLTTIANPSTTYTSTGFSVLAASTNSATLFGSSSSSSALSPGAAAGIAVAATVVFALLCALGVYIFWRVRRDRAEDRAAAAAAATGGSAAAGGVLASGAGAGTGTYRGPGPAVVPPDYKHVAPQQQQQMSQMGQVANQPQGYYAPNQGPGNGAAGGQQTRRYEVEG